MNRHVVSARAALCVAVLFLACGGGTVAGPAPAPVKTCVLQSTNTTGVNGESQFRSNYVSTPATGAAIVTNGIFSNIYLWPTATQTSMAQNSWDGHLKSLGAPAVPSETSEVLDQITCDLVHTSYFDALTQYGIAPPVYAGDEATLPSCVNPVMQSATNNAGVIQWDAIKDFVNCEEAASGPKTTQVNVFLSPDLKVARFSLSQAPDLCTTGSNAYHWGSPGTRNYTVIPTSSECSGNIATLTHALSHEMVETVSDPGGFGWVHETIPGRFPGDMETEFSEGELGDICSHVGLHPTADIPFDDPSAGVGSLAVAAYWSNADNACVPSFLMNATLLAKTGNPIVRFTGDVHEVNETLALPTNVASQQLQALEIAITTGGDDLRGGSNPGDNATVVLHLSSGDTYTITNINESNEWSNNALHTAFLGFPPGISAGSIQSVSITTNFGGGIAGDNWNVNGITLKAAVSAADTGCQLTSATLVNAQGTATLRDGSTGLVRMTGDLHDWRTGTQLTGAQPNQLVTGLLLTVGTGGDDLRGGISPSDNADAVITLGSGQTFTFPNINASGTWTNYSTVSVPLLTLNALPANTTLGDITALDIVTHFSGGIGGDNWDIKSVVLQAGAGCPRNGGAPVTSTVTLLDTIGTASLPDGSIGLVRFTGDVHDWPVNVPVPSNIAGATLVGLQLIITTGNDDLRGGGQPSDNANAIIHFTSAGDVTFYNINQSQHWDNGTTHTVTLAPLPSATTVGSIQALTIHTAFTGGLSGDNWDVNHVIVVATIQQ